MTAAEPLEPVAADVFDFLDEYLDAAENDEIDDESPVKPPAPIGDFLYTFFQQFFDAGWKMEVVAIDQTAKVQAARIRLALDRDKNRATVKLIASFEELCDIWTDLLGFQYGGHRSDVELFHSTYLPRLLQRVVDWARFESHPQIARRAEEGLARLKILAT